MNQRKHGIAFKEAARVFRDPLSITVDDPDHSEEDRYIIIGLFDAGRLLMVSHTERGSRTRIINARERTRSEREAYEEEIKNRLIEAYEKTVRGDWVNALIQICITLDAVAKKTHGGKPGERIKKYIRVNQYILTRIAMLHL